MSRSTYWIDKRIKAQRAIPRTTSSLAVVREVSLDLIGSRADVRRRGGIIPSWVGFGMILLATFAVCVTVNMRTRTKLHTASEQFALIQTDVEALRSTNNTMRQEINKLKTDPRTIELAARSSLNMVRNNEFVVPVE